MSDGARAELTVHVLRVTLLDVTPPVWRLLRVPSAVTLRALHDVVQVAMGWENRHLHEWRVGERSFGAPDEEDWGEQMEDESGIVLADVAPADSVLEYDYDLGDGWEHLVEVIAVEAYDATVPPVAVLDGARAAPPEDSGGPQGYEHLLDALAEPTDVEHDEVMAWLGDGFDPERFDPVQINRRLEPLRRPDV
ncbi:MAG: plasmid pRiA4b ORF-3 family protein [Acidimicrobiales bacterium]|nr:plasmid pRiA4b ORF-3 family protein [Acidimicrobiales bacterium]